MTIDNIFNIDFLDIPYQEHINLIDIKFNQVSKIFEEHGKEYNKKAIKKANRKANRKVVKKVITKNCTKKCSKNCNKINCIKEECFNHQYKENICKFHYKQIKTNVCHINGCVNIIFRNKMCHKHTISKCIYLNCKKSSYNNKFLCKIHNIEYKDICSIRDCKIERLYGSIKCAKHFQ